MQIRELDLLTQDLGATRKFYGQVLELPVTTEADGHLSIRLAESVLRFHQAAKDQLPRYHFAFNIAQNKIEEAAEWLHGKAEKLPVTDGAPIANFVNWNAHAVYFFDNNGNILEFIARHDLPNGSDEVFGAHLILSVSEMGVVGATVSETCQHLIKTYGLAFFSRQPPLPDFAAVGDDDGLFIMVPTGRPWYPTKIPSETHWFRTRFRYRDTDHVFEPWWVQRS